MREKSVSPRNKTVVPPQLDVVKCPAAAQNIVRYIQNVIGLVVWSMPLEQMQMLINALGQADAVHQLMHRADSARSDRSRLLGHLVMDVPPRKLRPVRARLHPALRTPKSSPVVMV